MVENNQNMGFEDLEDDDFEMDYDMTDETGIEESYDDDVTFDFDSPEQQNTTQLSLTPDKIGSTKVLKLKDFTKVALSMDASKPSPQDCEMLSEIEFKSDAEVQYANALRDKLYATADNSSALYYKDLFAEKEKDKVSHLKKHIAYVDNVYNRFLGLYSAKVQDAAQVKASLEDSLRAPRENLKTKENNNDKYADLRYNELKFNYGEVEARYYKLLRQGKEYSIKTTMVLKFLHSYYKLYAQFSEILAEKKYKDTALLRDGEIDNNYLTCKCTACQGENVIHTSKLPHIEVGRMTYNIDILENLKQIYEYCVSVENEVKKNALELLTRALTNLNMEAVLEKANSTFEDDYDKIKYLERPQVLAGLTKEEINYYKTALMPQLKHPARFTLIETFNALCIDSKPLKTPMDAVIFSDIAVPTLRNVLNNRHPLMMKGIVDTVNANSKTSSGVPVWKEIINEGITKGDPQAEYKMFKNTLKLVDFIYNQLDDNFQYPNDSLVSKNVDIVYQAERMQGTVNVLPNSPLRFVIPDMICQECGRPLLFHSSIMYASRSYMEHLKSKQTLIDVMDSASVNLTAIIGPALKAKLKVRTEPTKKRTYDPFERLKGNGTDNREVRIKNTPVITPEGELSDGYSGTNITELEMVKAQYGFITDQLASRFCAAKRRGDKIAMAEIRKENEERKNRVNSSKVADNTITPERVASIMEELGIPTEELAIRYLMAEKDGNMEELNKIMEELQAIAEEQLSNTEDSLMDTLLAEYNGADLNTLSYDELTSKGLYKYENLLRLYNFSESQYDCVEAILIAIMGDEQSLATLPKALQDSINEYYEFRDGTPTELLSSLGIIM